MAVQVFYLSQVTILETFTGPYVGTNSDTTLDGLNTTKTLNANTNQAITKATAFQKTLSGGTGTIDLTNMTGLTADEVVNCNGLKLQIVKLRNLANNANTIQVINGASNGYNLLGASFKITLQPGQEVTIDCNNTAPVINSTLKTLDLSGTGSQVLECMFSAG